MLIGIDGNEANIENRVGINHYAFQVLWGLHKLSDNKDRRHEYVVFLKNPPLGDLPKATKWWRYTVIPGGGMWIIRKFMPALYRMAEKPVCLFSPSHYVPPLAPVPRICAIMDVGYLKFSGQFNFRDFWQLKLWTAISLIVSKRIIAISHATKKDIVRHYPKVSKRLRVTQLGYAKEIYNDKLPQKLVRQVMTKYTIGYEYVLYLGTLKPSKNIEGLLTAWSLIGNEFPNTQLVIAGKKGWLYDSIFEKVISLGLETKVIFTDFVPEGDKPALIAGARLFAIPSFWEGFGLDVLSSLAVGTPVLASDRGSLPEVVGDAGVIVDPDKPEEIAAGIKRILSMDKKSYNNLIKRGFAQAEKFDWEKTARETLAVLEEVDQ